MYEHWYTIKLHRKKTIGSLAGSRAGREAGSRQAGKQRTRKILQKMRKKKKKCASVGTPERTKVIVGAKVQAVLVVLGSRGRGLGFKDNPIFRLTFHDLDAGSRWAGVRPVEHVLAPVVHAPREKAVEQVHERRVAVLERVDDGRLVARPPKQPRGVVAHHAKHQQHHVATVDAQHAHTHSSTQQHTAAQQKVSNKQRGGHQAQREGRGLRGRDVGVRSVK